METSIYKISSTLGDKIYIGSTTKQLDQRLTSHKYNYNAWKNGTLKKRVSSFIVFDEYGIENCIIDLLEMFPNLSTEERRTKEGEYIKSMPCVNHNIAGTTKKESNKLYREKNKEKRKAYVEENRSVIQEKNREWRDKNKERVAESNKVYFQLHKEKKAEQQRERRKKKAIDKMNDQIN